LLIDLTVEELHQLLFLIVADAIASVSLDRPIGPMPEGVREALLEKLGAALRQTSEASIGSLH
jgi:hypothetical protein